MLVRIYFLIILLLALPTAYLFVAYVRPRTRRIGLRMLSLLPAVLLLAYFLLISLHDDMRVAHQAQVGTFCFLFFLLTAPAMLFTLIDLPACLLRGKARRTGRIVAMTVGLTAALILCYGYFEGRRHYVVHRQTFAFSNLPARFDGYRIVQFSDLHIGTFADGHRADVERIVSLINGQRPDAILFCGDLVNFESRELCGYDSLLSSLHAHDGVFAVAGNHDYPSYIRQSAAAMQKDMARLRRQERAYGWRLLLNDHVVLRRGADSLAIIGVENDGNPPFPSLGDLPKATRGLRGVMRERRNGQPDRAERLHTFAVLMSHDPTHWRRAVVPDTRIDLTLSGHTHASQFKVFGWSPCAFVYDEWSGTYTDGAQVLNVSEGVGQIMMPFRFGAWPEVNVITLKCAKPAAEKKSK